MGQNTLEQGTRKTCVNAGKCGEKGRKKMGLKQIRRETVRKPYRIRGYTLFRNIKVGQKDI